MTHWPHRGLRRDETYRRLPALRRIERDDVRRQTARLSATAPAYFWTAPASTSGYHHPRCRGEHGLWAHTLATCTAVERLVDSYAERFDVVPDHARAAAILHDQRKNGPPDSPAASAVSDHDVRMARVVREEADLPEAVADAVAAHMGPWYDGPSPATPLEELLHTADMLASSANATLAIPEPVPDELAALGFEPAEF